MAAPVRIESEAFTDPRFDILGQLLGSDRYSALGVMAHIWSWATERGQYEIPILIASVFVGMDISRVTHIVTSGLATPGEPGHIRIRGSEGRVEWLGDLRSMRVAGGKARAAGAARGPDGRLVSTSTSSKLVQQGRSAGTSRKPAPSSALTLDPVLVPDPAEDQQNPPNPPARKPRSKPSDPTSAELASVRTVLSKLTARNGVAYQQSKEHTRLIVARLRDGMTEMDLRKVIGYCAMELGWTTKPTMQAFLRPETLFGPETVQRYVHAARAWYDKLPEDENGARRPGATIHLLPLPPEPETENIEPEAEGEASDDAGMLSFDPEGEIA